MVQRSNPLKQRSCNKQHCLVCRTGGKSLCCRAGMTYGISYETPPDSLRTPLRFNQKVYHVVQYIKSIPRLQILREQFTIEFIYKQGLNYNIQNYNAKLQSHTPIISLYLTNSSQFNTSMTPFNYLKCTFQQYSLFLTSIFKMCNVCGFTPPDNL